MSSIARRLVVVVLVFAAAACQSTSIGTFGPTPLELTITVPVQSADKAVIEAAADVLSARLQALGIGTFSSTIGAAMAFQIAVPDRSIGSAVTAALKARGIVEFLPAGDDPPGEGDPAPANVEPIFDAGTEIRSATLVDDGSGGQAVSIELEPDGTKALAAYTNANVGKAMLLVLDGVVIAAPVINEPLIDGKVQLTFPSTGPVPPAAIAAIMSAGPMPAGWAAP